MSAPRAGSGAMFDAIAGRYDLLNRVLSAGLDRRWRRNLVHALGLPAGARVLDLATGTADVAIAIATVHPDAHVVGLDPSPRMLEVARQKVHAAQLGDRISLMEGDAEQLPLPDASFDAVTMAFGIRNVPDRPRALGESVRVLRSGGVLAILELGEPRDGVLGAIGRWHVHGLVPRLGALLSGAREYRYLADSIARFPRPDLFAAQLLEAGLHDVHVQAQTLGACHLYVGRRP